MMKLYWCPRTRSFSSLWLMEESGQPYERVMVDIAKGAQREPGYLAINPMGKVPALQDGASTLAESAAICAYVAERYPQARLAPPLGDPLRAKYLYWLFFAPGCIEPAMVQLATKDRDEPGRRRLGRCTTGIRRAGCRACEGTVDSRRKLFGRRYRDRIGTEFRGPAVQDGARAPFIRPLYRCLRRAAGIPARKCACRRIEPFRF